MQQGAPIVINNTTNTYNINANTYNVNAPVSFNQNSTKDDRQHHHISVAQSNELSEPTGNATVEYLDEVDEDVGEEQNGGQDVGEEQKQGEDVVEEHNGGQDVGEEQKQGEDVVEEHNQNRGGWACNLCTFQNENNIEICGGCGHTRGTTSATSDAALDADADAAYSATSDAEPRRTTSRSTDATSASHATDATSDIDDEVQLLGVVNTGDANAVAAGGSTVSVASGFAAAAAARHRIPPIRYDNLRNGNGVDRMSPRAELKFLRRNLSLVITADHARAQSRIAELRHQLAINDILNPRYPGVDEQVRMSRPERERAQAQNNEAREVTMAHQCVICLEPMDRGMLLPECSHVVCQQCHVRTIASGKCPMCRTSF